MTTAIEREDLWTPGAGVLDLDAPGSRRDPLLRDLPESELRRVLQSGAARHLESLAASPDAWSSLRKRVFDLRQAAWQVLCPLDEDSVVVDLDAGYGAVTRALARTAGFVLGVDDVRARLLIADALHREQQVDNVRLACGDVGVLASWPAARVDGVWLGRRLEELGGAGGWSRPAEVLRDVRRVLRPGGWLALAGRNGRELRRMVRGSSLPGVRGWIALLAEAGFEDVQVHAAAPDAEHASTLAPLEPDGDISAALREYGVRKRWKLGILSLPAFRSWVARDLLLVARVGTSSRPRCLQADDGSALRTRKLYLSAAKASAWYRDGRHERIRDIPLDPEATASLARIEAVAAAWHGRSDTPSFFSGRRVAAAGGRTWMDRPLVNGTPLAEWSRGAPPLGWVCRRLRSFAEVGERVALPVLGRGDVVDHFLNANANARALIDPTFARRLRNVAEALGKCDPGGRTILMHGDFTPNNVFLDGDCVEPIDWDLAVPVDFPGYDLLNLLWYRHCGPHPESRVWARTIADCAHGRVDPETVSWIAEAYPDADPVDVMATFVVLRLARGTAFGNAWIAKHALPALARAEEWLSLPAPPG